MRTPNPLSSPVARTAQPHDPPGCVSGHDGGAGRMHATLRPATANRTNCCGCRRRPPDSASRFRHRHGRCPHRSGTGGNAGLAAATRNPARRPSAGSIGRNPRNGRSAGSLRPTDGRNPTGPATPRGGPSLARAGRRVTSPTAGVTSPAGVGAPIPNASTTGCTADRKSCHILQTRPQRGDDHRPVAAHRGSLRAHRSSHSGWIPAGLFGTGAGTTTHAEILPHRGSTRQRDRRSESGSGGRRPLAHRPAGQVGG